MKNSAILIFFLSISHFSFSQIKHIEVLIMWTDSEVTHYMDSLNSLKKNSYYKVQKDVSKDGDLILSTDFALDNQDFYTCTSIMTKFERINGIEVCISQIILGSARNAQSNLSFIKDNFKFVSEGRWEKPYGQNLPIKIIATFDRKDGEYPSYSIMYEAEEIK